VDSDERASLSTGRAAPQAGKDWSWLTGRRTGRAPTGPVAGRAGPRALGGGARDLDDALLVWLVPLAALAALPFVVGHLATLLATGDVPRYDLHEAPGIAGRVLANLGDPGRAWDPVNTGARVPGPVAWWGTAALLSVLVGLAVFLAWSYVRPAGRQARGWAPPADLRPLWLKPKDRSRLVLGTSGAHRIGVRDRHSVLVVGPAHSGKSSALTVPAVLEWQGPVVVASTKGHVIDETIGWRSRQGDVHVYDPAAVTPYHRSGWSVLSGCTTWQGSIRTAADLTLAARAVVGASRGGDGVTVEGRGDLWRSSMAMALAPFLFAAVSSGRTIGAAAEWIEREERDEVLEVLEGVDRLAARAHTTTFMRRDESRSAFLHAMHQILSVYEDPVVASSMDRHEIVPDELLDGGTHTLYLTTPEYDQARFRPLCALIVRQTVATAYERSARLGGALPTPLLVVLDDVLGIAPIYDLASLASTAPARGVQLLSVFQDTDQIAEHYGAAADLVIRSHGAKVVLAALPGREGRAADILGRELTADLGLREGALLYGARRPAKIALRPWFRSRELRRRVATSQDSLMPVEGRQVGDRRRVDEQASAWLARRSRRGRAASDDPTVPFDLAGRDNAEIFGSLDDTAQHNVTPMPGSHWRGGPGLTS
jgi:type IV secretion system protein VirD4